MTSMPISGPVSQSDLSPITALAATKNVKCPDSVALAIELKTAWVLVSSVSNPNDYVTITAAVPRYNKTSTQWTLVPNVLDTVQLAMIGAHIVGSVAGHPEMIWATFVHDSTAPDSTYTYTNSSNSPAVVPVNTTGSWVLCADGAVGPYNQMRQTFDLSTGNIVATPGNTIGASNILTMKPWGAGSDLSPNPIDGSPAASNAEIISVNNSVRGALIAGDPRKNYIFRGATWTTGGPPTPPPALGQFARGGNEVGTSSLANVTMETFEQGNTFVANGTNCFDCHQAKNPSLPVADTFVSHIFPFLKPLF
jgi:hypothetical protein